MLMISGTHNVGVHHSESILQEEHGTRNAHTWRHFRNICSSQRLNIYSLISLTHFSSNYCAQMTLENCPYQSLGVF